MRKINKHIVIVRTSTKQLSSMSQFSSDALTTLLSKHFSKVSVAFVENQEDLTALVSMKPDLAFMGMQTIEVSNNIENESPEEIWLSEYLDKHDIAYTGSPVHAHKFEKNKALAKQQILDSGLNTSAFFVTGQNSTDLDVGSEMEFPLFVKPEDRGGGLGIDGKSVVHNFNQLNKKVASIANKHNSNSLVEEYLDGREFSVAILRESADGEYMAMPLELIAPLNDHGSRLLSESVKSQDAETFLKVKNAELYSTLCEVALDIFDALGAKDYGRIDIRLDSSGTPQFLEANLIPSLIEGYGSFPKACLVNRGMSYEDMILHIVDLGLSTSSEEFEIDPETITKMPTLASL